MSTKSIAVVGGGAAGLAALKTISQSTQFRAGLWSVQAFEARDNVGGVWLPAPPTDHPPLTPLYDSLTTNLPHPLMAYTSFPFPPSTPLFPNAAAVQSYLQAYRDHFNLSPYIRLNTTVSDIQWHPPHWRVTTNTTHVLSFDFLIIANGHYRVPIYPPIPGLQKWLQQGKASHSAYYRRPHNLGPVVLIVGAGPSGQDISSEMRLHAQTVIHSMTNASPLDSGNLKIRGRVVEFRDDNNQVVFEDGSIESGISHCILATGYSLSFPFIPIQTIINLPPPPPIPPLPSKLHKSTYHLFPLAKHIFPLHFPAPSLAFMGLLTKVVPFPIFEASAHAIVKVLSDPSSLDLTQETNDILSRYRDLCARYGDDQVLVAKAWHRFAGDEQFEYRDQLYAFAFAGDDGGGGSPKVEDWEKEAYEEKLTLRNFWRELEASGEAEDWVRGVGEGGKEEWVQLIKRMLRVLKERGGSRL